MKRFVAGADRSQSTLLPEGLDDWVDESNPVRVIDAFVDALNVAELGFDWNAYPDYWGSLLDSWRRRSTMSVMLAGGHMPWAHRLEVRRPVGLVGWDRATW